MPSEHEVEVAGRLSSIERGQKDLIHAVTKKLDDHENRVRALERARNMLAGAVTAISAGLVGLFKGSN